MKKLLFLLPLLTMGCASLPFRITGWNDNANRVFFENGESAHILGNPYVSCYNKNGFLIANGIFVYINSDYLIVDEWGSDYAFVRDSDSGNYCYLGNR
jgi:hypothetical protein